MKSDGVYKLPFTSDLFKASSQFMLAQKQDMKLGLRKKVFTLLMESCVPAHLVEKMPSIGEYLGVVCLGNGVLVTATMMLDRGVEACRS